jgi:hypothetical protein
MAAFLLFVTPLLFFGIGAVCAAQVALEFPDAVRDALVVLVMAGTIVLESRLGPSRVEGRR